MKMELGSVLTVAWSGHERNVVDGLGWCIYERSICRLMKAMKGSAAIISGQPGHVLRPYSTGRIAILCHGEEKLG